MSKNNKPKTVQLGSMWIAKDKSGKPILDSEGKKTYNISVAKDKEKNPVEILVNGQKVKYINITRPSEKQKFLLEKGFITEEQFDENMARIQKNEDLQFEISVSFE